MAGRKSHNGQEGKAVMKYHLDFDIDFKRNPYPGKFIVIEGIDGAGKTTQVNQLARYFSKTKNIFLTKEPTDGPIGKFIRKILVGKINLPLVSMQYLFSADRQAHQLQIIEHLKKGDTIIADRYFWSSLAYGIVDWAKDFEKATNLLLVAQGILSHYHQFIIPDISVYLDLPAEEAFRRLSQVRKTNELYEKKEQLKRIEKAYKWLIKMFPKEITVVDATKKQEKITEEILKLSF